MVNLSVLREAEFACVKQYFWPGIKVLEIGGGNGYQASLIAALGAYVESIDVVVSPAGGEAFYPVRIYDGITLPFSADSFDLIFSSNVLEHVSHLDQMLAEFHRVLKRMESPFTFCRLHRGGYGPAWLTMATCCGVCWALGGRRPPLQRARMFPPWCRRRKARSWLSGAFFGLAPMANTHLPCLNFGTSAAPDGCGFSREIGLRSPAQLRAVFSTLAMLCFLESRWGFGGCWPGFLALRPIFILPVLFDDTRRNRGAPVGRWWRGAAVGRVSAWVAGKWD